MKNSELARLPINQPERFNELPVERQQKLLMWIENHIRGNEKALLKFNSYKLKHLYSEYVENGQFKGAMLAAGYEPIDTNLINWKFRNPK